MTVTDPNHDHPADPRQHGLTGALRCYYDAPRHHKLRPDCDGVAVVAYGPTTLCASCDLRRSTVGKGTTPRPVPGVELAHLIAAAQAATNADTELAHAAHAARQAGASWTQIGDALGLTRQAAQQRWRPRQPTTPPTAHSASESPDTHTRHQPLPNPTRPRAQ